MLSGEVGHLGDLRCRKSAAVIDDAELHVTYIPMHYIRYLKAPVASSSTNRSQCHIQTLITITSDLGDSFYGGNLHVLARVLESGDEDGERENERMIRCQWFQWRTGMRAMPLQITFYMDEHSPGRLMRLMVSAALEKTDNDPKYHPYQSIRLADLPRVVSAWSEPFSVQVRATKREVERRFEIGLPGARTLCIKEESGESIARHIWSESTYFFPSLLSEPLPS